MPKKNPKHRERERIRKIEETKLAARGEARRSLGKLQFVSGTFLLLSAFFGIFLLASDQSLWILAVSHAYGLVAIVGIDLMFGVLSLLMVKRVFLWGVAGALLGVLLQIGDIVTAPQYGMTVQYFASYLFSLWAFDSLLVAQVLVVFAGLFSRVHIRTLTDEGRYRTEFSASRRAFLKSMIAFAAIVGITTLFSLAGQSRPSLPSSAQGLPQGAVANTSQVQSGSPAYFEYPSGYPNILLKKNDGSLIALSMLCTHICCQLNFDPSGNQLYCPCHGSLFDENGNVLQGPAVVNLPTVVFTVDNSGNVFPQRVQGSGPCTQGLS